MAPGTVTPGQKKLTSVAAVIVASVKFDSGTDQKPADGSHGHPLTVKDFLEKREGSSLRAWLRHFDRNNDQKIGLSEFMRGMRRLHFPGDITAAFTQLDEDKSGELSLDEIDHEQASLWRRFRAWCVAEFEGPQDFIIRCSQSSRHSLSLAEFSEGLRACGWREAYEELLFSAQDTEDMLSLTLPQLRWLDTEKRRRRRKEQAKERAMSEKGSKKSTERKVADGLLADFKRFLKIKYGHYIRAWRCALSPDSSMFLHKSDLFKAVTTLGWAGDVRMLWRAFDKDDSGYISIEELDARGAEILAHFALFVREKWGNASNAFRAFDKYNTRKVRQAEFINALKSHGFPYPAKSLFHGLDLHANKSLVEEDILFLDRWRPPAFLVARPNPVAAQDVRDLLLKNFKNYLKAWRWCLDKDSSNRCNWEEFQDACSSMSYSGDMAGAWRALDEDLSGFITLNELDPFSSEKLLHFKRWATDEFGGVRSAFGVFDTDGSNEVSYREFRRACRVYGFDRDVHALFHALDVEHNNALSVDEVTFLDEWEFDFASSNAEGDEDKRSTTDTFSTMHITMLSRDELTTAYSTEGPGPAAYDVPSSFGAGPMVPMARFSGAFSFRKRPQMRLPQMRHPKEDGELPAPVDYDDRPGLSIVSRKKPAWGFGTATRQAVQANGPESTVPGPGRYAMSEHRRLGSGPSAYCSPRRPLRVHPLFRSDGFSSIKAATAPPGDMSFRAETSRHAMTAFSGVSGVARSARLP